MTTDLSTQILDCIASAGGRDVFGIPGDAINGFVDATRRHDAVNFVTMRHEEAGAFAASAQAKLTGKLGVCAGTAGPGAIHLLNGLYDAKLDSAPVLAVTGQLETTEIGKQGQQEIDILRLFDDVSVFNETVVSPRQMPDLIHNAVREAISSRGVAHLNIPSDLALADVDGDGRLTLPEFAAPQPDPDSIARAAEILNEAAAVTILIGIGAREAIEEIVEIAENLGAPILKALRGKELIPDDHPLSTGGIGLLGTRASVRAMDRADVLLMIGTDLPFPDFYPDKARCIQVDIDPSQIGRRKPVDVGLVGDAKEVTRALARLLDARADRTHLDLARAEMDEWRAELRVAEQDDTSPIRPQRLAASISDNSQPGTIFVCDTGAVTAWAARHLTLKTGDRFTLSSWLASMAFALPGAIGAQLAYPDRSVVALAGDGGFSMLIGDLMTAVDLRLPVTVVVFNNSKLGLIQAEQEAEGLPEYAVELDNPDFAAVARAMGAEGIRIEAADDLGAALASAFASGRPSVVDVVIDPEELPIPPEIEGHFVLGYTGAKLKEFVQGEGLAGVRNTLKQTVERITN